MRYILLPIHPEWCCKFMNGDKETEVRRGTTLYNAINRLIEEQGCAPCLMYCTMGKKLLGKTTDMLRTYWTAKEAKGLRSAFNGKVIAKFEATAEEIRFDYRADFYGYRTDTLNEIDLGERSCLHHKELDDYLKEEKGTAIHVKPGTMRTDGFPKELSDFNKPDVPTYEQSKPLIEMIRAPYTEKDYREDCKRLGYCITKAPQSWCYAEADE